jgi:hypothetical protein
MRAAALAALLLMVGCGGTGSDGPAIAASSSAPEAKTEPSTQVEMPSLDKSILALESVRSPDSSDGLDAKEIKSVQSAFDRILDGASKL